MKSRFYLILVIIPLFFFARCSKESSEEKLDRVINSLVDEISADNLEIYVNWLEDMETRFCLADNRREVAVAIMNRMKDFGYANARLDSFYLERTWRENYYALWEYNVVATLEGTGSTGEMSVIGAHYDNILREGDPFYITPGANDNASGVAAMLEIARVLKREKYVPSSNIEFVAFGAEELGLHGSSYYASTLAATGKVVKVMLNNDMIAYEPSDTRSDWLVNIINYPASSGLTILAEELCQEYTDLGFYTDNTHQNQSDSYSFAEAGFPALFFAGSSEDPFYHTTNDLAVTLNYEYCSEITALCCALLVRLDKLEQLN